MTEEKIFTINLRREFIKKPHYQRAKKAVTAVREFISKHLKVEEVKIGKNLNQKILEHGTSSPPPKVKVKAFLEEKVAYVELEGFEYEKPKPQEETAEEVKEVDKKKEQEKELQKELKTEEEIKQKKEHKHEVVEKPGKEVKQQGKVMESIERETKVIGRTGKKSAKEPKP